MMLVLSASCAHDELSTGVWVHDLTIKGTRALSTGDIKDKLATRKTGWWPFASRRWFDEAAFDLDLQRVKAFYADHGYFDARVTSHEVKHVKGDAVDVVIEVQENSPTVVKEVRFKGFPADTEARGRKLAASRDLAPDQVFDFPAYAEVKGLLADRLKEDGYAYGQIGGGVDVDRDKHTATIEFVGQPGPKVRFGTTSVDGNGAIPAWKLLNRVTWKPGDTYDPHDVGTTQGRLYDLGVFSSVRLDLPETPVEVADVKVHVKPGKLYELRLGGGVGAELQREEIRGRAELTINNFLGGLRKLRLRIRPAYVAIPSVFDVQQRGPAAENDASAHAAGHLREQRVPSCAGWLRPRHRGGLPVLRSARAARARSAVLPGTGPRRRLVEFSVPQLLQRQRERLQHRRQPVLRFPGPLSARVPGRVHPDRSARPSARPELRRLLAGQRRAERRGARQRVQLPQGRAGSPTVRAARASRGRRGARTRGMARAQRRPDEPHHPSLRPRRAIQPSRVRLRSPGAPGARRTGPADPGGR